MKKNVFLGFVVLMVQVAAGSVADMPAELRADHAAVVAAAETETSIRHPDADYVYIDDRIHTRYEADGSDVTWDDEWVKVLTEKGRRSCSSVSLGFSERYGDAGVLCVEVIGTNGVVRTIDFEKTLKVTTDNSSLSVNIVDPLDKKLTFSVPGLAAGEIRHVRFWKRKRRARMKDTWCDVNSLEYTQPIADTTVSVEMPKSRPLVHAALRNAFSNTVTRLPDVKLADGYVRTTWKAHDVPQAFPEPNMPALSRCAQTLRLSTIKDWQTVSRWYWQICVPHLSKTTTAMTNEVSDVTKDCADDAAKIRALFKFVSQKIRYMGLTLEDNAPGYEPHDVDITFDNRYGVCRDKAALLVAMLRIAGIEAYPVLIHAGAKMDAEIPMPYFNHAIVAVKQSAGRLQPKNICEKFSGDSSGDWQLMDPTNESTKDLLPAYLSDKSYLVATPAGEPLRTSPVTSADANKLKVDSEGTLDENGNALLTTTFAFDGINDTVVRKSLLKKAQSARRQWIEGVWRNVSVGTELLSFEIHPADLHDTDKPVAVKTVVRLPEIVLRGKTQDTLSLPFVTKFLGVVNNLLDDNTALEMRRFPLLLPCTASVAETLRLNLGDALSMVNGQSPMVNGVAVRNESFLDVREPQTGNVEHGKPEAKNKKTFLFTRDVKCTNGVLTARREMRVNAIEFDVAEYDALRNVRKEAETAERVQPVFPARGEDDDAHLRYRKCEQLIYYSSPTAWVSTNVIEKEVLTERGRKTAGELKFSYVPVGGNVELVSAVVSNRNGRVYPVTPKEVNVLDGSWTASAPRYPESKMLVANLPGVEIGSVISYAVVRTVTNASVAASFFYSFGGISPTDSDRIVVHVPRDVDFHHSEKRLPKGAFSVTTNENEFVYEWTMRNIPRQSDEASQPPASRWRPCVTVSLADWEKNGKSLVRELKKNRDGGEPDIPGGETPAEIITSARRLLRNIRTAGPGIFDLPFDCAFTPVSRVLSEGYGSRTDRMNLMYAMLERAGFDCSFVLVANDAKGFRGNEKGWRKMPRPTMFDTLVIRAVWREGWIPFMRKETVFWVSAENEYTPPEASSCFGNSYYDPQDDVFGRINAPGEKWQTHKNNFTKIEVRENGSADFSLVYRTYGSGVGSLRKYFNELLPEMRSRVHQKFLGALAQNATATSEFETDTDGYPFSLSFDAYAEGYAVAADDTITIKVPDFDEKVFDVGGGRRNSPVYLGGKDEVVDAYEVVFPKGYTHVEMMPKGFEIVNPLNPKDVWLRHEVSHRIDDERLSVTIRRRVTRNSVTQLDAAYHPFLNDWNRRAAAESVRTISVKAGRSR